MQQRVSLPAFMDFDDGVCNGGRRDEEDVFSAKATVTEPGVRTA
jgi:hypothetical protein